MLDVRLSEAASGATPVDVAGAPDELRVDGAGIARSLESDRARLAMPPLSGPELTAFVEGLVLGGYAFRADGRVPRRRIELVGPTDTAALQAGLDAAAATVWARDLANTPAATMTPAALAARVRRELVPLGVEVAVRDVAWLRAHGFGGLLAVGAGAAAAPCFLEARWRPRGATPGVHLVVVGKGITFDTGGLNRKVGDAMRLMHTDMSGAAAALAALRAVATQRLPVRVTVLVPAAENAISGAAFRPGDVVRHYGGRTSEIGNTDAEGRLVLADAMAYAVARLAPTALVDIATLTGAAKVALGLRTAGLFATSEPLATALADAGAQTGEPVWRLPLLAEYESALRSDIADATNSPGNPRAITAALFLRPFAGGVPWAHLDIAGPARSPEDDGIASRGATGFGARLLHRWVASSA